MKISEGSPNVVDRIESGDVDLVINTPTGSGARSDGYEIRRAAVARGIPCITTMTGATAAQRAIGALRTGRARGALAPGAARGAPHGRAGPRRERRAPHAGAVRQASLDRGGQRAARRLPADLDGRCPTAPPIPRPGQFYMLAAAEGWGGGGGRAALPPACLLVRARERARGRRRPAGLPARGRGPGHRAPGAARAGRASCGSPARSALASHRPRTAPARCWSAAGSARRRCSAGRTSSAPGPRCCSASARPRTPRPARLFAGEPDLTHRRRLAGPRRAGHGAACERRSTCRLSTVDCRPSTACGPPQMLEAVRALCAERDVPAQLALESGMACGFGACYGCVVPDPERLRAPLRGRSGARRRRARDRARGRGGALSGLELCGVVAARAGAERLGHLRRDRRPPHLRRRPARALPLRRLRVEDDHARARARATRRRACGRRPPG